MAFRKKTNTRGTRYRAVPRVFSFGDISQEIRVIAQIPMLSVTPSLAAKFVAGTVLSANTVCLAILGVGTLENPNWQNAAWFIGACAASFFMNMRSRRHVKSTSERLQHQLMASIRERRELRQQVSDLQKEKATILRQNASQQFQLDELNRKLEDLKGKISGV